MRIRAISASRHDRCINGVTLVECLVYISVLAVLLGVGSAALYRCWDDNKAITRNADDIVRMLKAGENWRADIRSATGPIRLKTNASEQTILIPRGTNVLSYAFSNGELQKRPRRNTPWIVVLSKIKSSQMESDSRDNAKAWRWEVALEPRRKNAPMRPLFTFEAVAGNSSVQ